MIQFIKIRDVKSPVRNADENAGIDVYVPENTESFREALFAKNVNSNKLAVVDVDLTAQERSWRVAMNETKRLSYFDITDGSIHIAPHKAIIIPCGLMSKFENNKALIANNKSGIATKKQLIFGASVIDAGYQGEWHINLINTSDEYQTVNCGTKAVQFIPHYISVEQVEVLDSTPEEFYTSKSERGAGGFGSTGLN